MRCVCFLWAAWYFLGTTYGKEEIRISGNETLNRDDFIVNIFGVAPDGRASSGAALAEVGALVVRAAGVAGRAVAPPAACGPPGGGACLAGALRALAARRAAAGVVAVAAARAPAAPRLRDAGLEEVGDAAPAWRRACLAPRGPARSLLDLAEPRLAARYHLSTNDQIFTGVTCASRNCTFVPDWCAEESSKCATILVRDDYEKSIIEKVIRDNQLHSIAYAIGPQFNELANIVDQLNVIVCVGHWEYSQFSKKYSPLGPPPCQGSDLCPFEPYRLVKIANVRALAEYPSVIHSLVHLTFTVEELTELSRLAISGPAEAARAYVVAHPPAMWPREARVAVLLPATSDRDAYDAYSYKTAAELVERELVKEWASRRTRFKVEVFDDRCSAPRAYKYLTDALGTGEYGALSAVAGPACRAAFADVARQSPAHELPVLAYSPQAAPRAPLVLLAAGDARGPPALWAALLAAAGWRRLALLSEPATASSLDVARLQDYQISSYKLVGDYDTVRESLTQWAERAVSTNQRIVYVCVEDARLVRAALCAGVAAGLSPAAGAVWLLPDAPALLRPAPGEPCSAAQLARAAEGHLRAAPAWRLAWDPARHRRWAALCPGCSPRAALLYDMLHLWAGALWRLLAVNPSALANLHHPDVVSSLIEDVTSTEFEGLTGPFIWNIEDNVHVRSTPLVIQQWQNGSYVNVGTWHNNSLTLNETLLKWQTSDGRTPDDGGERCALGPLAALAGGDCRAAGAVLAGAALAALAAACSAAALYCRRRAERDLRERLHALALRSCGLKPDGLDRWELPRERVVINRKLGTGAFGTVYGGHALLAENRGWSAVAVKTLKPGAPTDEKLDFLSEAESMKRFDHKNVVRLLGMVTKTEPVCTVMEFMLYGDLKNFLLARRHLAAETECGADEAAEEVSPRRLTAMALDVARALSYLAQMRYVHRDVAARNCLVSAHRVVKLADFGMTRLVFDNDYYRLSRKGMLPVRWMAPESLALGVFSPASDVWSFGVLLYEIVTFGSLPFQGLSNSEVLQRVKAGHTLELPSGLTPQLQGLIKSCWRREHRSRPGAAGVAAFLAEWPRLLAPCLDVPLDALDPLDLRRPDRAEARWVSWAAPASVSTDATYVSADGPQDGPLYGPGDGPLYGPLDGPLDGPQYGPLDGPIDEPLDRPVDEPQEGDAFLP